jgi:5-methylcytosine-specific restriction endonuclease McrA
MLKNVESACLPREASATGRSFARELSNRSGIPIYPGPHATQKGKARLVTTVSGCKTVQGDGKSWHTDHVIPRSKGGTNKDDNVVLSCATCNMRKRDKLDWRPRPRRPNHA